MKPELLWVLTLVVDIAGVAAVFITSARAGLRNRRPAGPREELIK